MGNPCFFAAVNPDVGEVVISLNCEEIDVILSELDVKDSFIQSIVQPGYDSIALYLYKTSYSRAKCLYICLAAGECRIHETKRTVPKNKTPLRFMEFFRSRIRGAKIRSCRQIGRERIIQMTVTQTGVLYFIFIRLWSGAANIIVTDDTMRILDVFYRRPKRGETSGSVFVLPESRNTSGCAHNMQGVAHKTDETEFVISKTEKSFKKRDFTQSEYAECFKNVDVSKLSFNEQTDIWYTEHGKSSSRSVLLKQAGKIYTQRLNRIESALQRLEEKRNSFLNADLWKHQGDLILAHAHLINPYGGKNTLECVDYKTGTAVCLHIDPKKTAAENAAEYYTKHKKARSGLADLECDIADLKQEAAAVQKTYKTVCAEENPLHIKQFLQKQGAAQKQRKKKHPGIGFVIGGWHILVGRTAAENDELLRHHVRGQDVWLHTRDYRGGYVFIKTRSGKTVPLELLIDAANLAVFYSKARKAKTADLYYTQVKYLRRAKNAPKGTVLPSQEKNITITLDNARIRKMEKMKVYD